MSFNWICPFCGHASVITDERQSVGIHRFEQGNRHGLQALHSVAVVCSNPECGEYQLKVALFDSTYIAGRQNYYEDAPQPKRMWGLVPDSAAKPFPEYVPQAIRNDYREACLIRELSPKASATLSRRALQGMIRDFWKVRERNLYLEIEAIREKVDTESWEAIDAVRKIGNIGAHMEQDINVIVDVEPEEAGLLIELIETLIEEWYLARHQRQQRMAGVKALAAEKQLAKLGNGAPKQGEEGGS